MLFSKENEAFEENKKGTAEAIPFIKH